jgi:hypothetical protein
MEVGGDAAAVSSQFAAASASSPVHSNARSIAASSLKPMPSNIERASALLLILVGRSVVVHVCSEETSE